MFPFVKRQEMREMITINGVTRSSDGESFSYRELLNEAQRRGFQVVRGAEKQKLIGLLCQKQVLYRQDVIAYCAENTLKVEELESGYVSVFEELQFIPNVLGITPVEEIVVIEMERGNAIGNLHLYNKQGEELKTAKFVEETSGECYDFQLRGFDLFFLESLAPSDPSDSPMALKVLNLKTMETKIVGDIEQGVRFSVEGKYLLKAGSAGTRNEFFELWNLETGKMEKRAQTYLGFNDIWLLDSQDFVTTSRDGTLLCSFEGDKIARVSLGEKNFALFDEGIVTVSGSIASVYDTKHKLLFESLIAPLGKSEVEGKGVKLRDCRVLLMDGENYVVFDVYGEKATGGRYIGASEVHYFPPDTKESREFLELISDCIPQSIPSVIAGIIERFI
jgi:hypothetical protein